jgi:hypothetical protein
MLSFAAAEARLQYAAPDHSVQITTKKPPTCAVLARTRHMGCWLSTSHLPMTTRCRRARVIATFSLRSPGRDDRQFCHPISHHVAIR